MNLAIDNNDGLGSVDYTPALLAASPLTIVRRRNQWTRCTGGLDVLGTSLPQPAANAGVLVTDAAGNTLFQGYLAENSAPTVAEAAASGTEGLPMFEAVEQGWLLQSAPVAVLQPESAAVRPLAFCDTVVRPAAASNENLKDLATDVSVSGEQEATAYVTELFRGDGTTAVFALQHAPYAESGVNSLIADGFDGGALNTAVWMRLDPGSYLGLGAGGLVLGGGNGYDGATILRGTQQVELGGTLVAEAKDLALAPGSDGLLMGFYANVVLHAGCIAGVRVRGVGGARTLVAVVGGTEQTATYTVATGHLYTLRVRLHCAETQRVRAAYSAVVDGAVQTFGGDLIDAPLHIVVEVLDQGLASNTLPSVLYDGAVPSSAARAVFAPVNSSALHGSIGSVSLKQDGSAWVATTAADGTVTTRRSGAVGTGADYALASAGTLTFDAGRVPQPGDLITVTYRGSGRSEARFKDAAAEASRAALALPGLPSWSGHVVSPKARSSADCVNAASALLALAAGSGTARSGHAAWVRGTAIQDDVYPGDTLALSDGAVQQLRPVQAVTIVDGNTKPETLTYRADFSQSRSTALSASYGEGLAGDLAVPRPLSADLSGMPPNLAGLQVTVATASALQIDAGIDLPDGSGIEVRRSDAHFGSASTADLVLQSPVRSFSLPRAAFRERFFIRMYDGSTPARYSPWSSVVLTSLPIA